MTIPVPQDYYEVSISAAKDDGAGGTVSASVYANFPVDAAKRNEAFNKALCAYRNATNFFVWELGATLNPATLKLHVYDDGSHVEVVLLDDTGRKPEEGVPTEPSPLTTG